MWGAKVYSGSRGVVGASVAVFKPQALDALRWKAGGRAGEQGRECGRAAHWIPRGAGHEMELSRQDMHWGDCGSSDSGGKGGPHMVSLEPLPAQQCMVELEGPSEPTG